MFLKAKSEQQSTDGTWKFLWELSDGETIESVIIPRQTAKGMRYTACISSQVGCAMGCTFCLTGTQGLIRNLTVDEVVAQVRMLKKYAPITNIVFMGMGEPLHNTDNVIAAIKVFLHSDEFKFSRRRILVSTSGRVTEIERLGHETGVALAISLNGSSNAVRSQVMPINRKWPIEELLEACRKYPVSSSRPITFEYVLLKGVNDSTQDAAQVFELLSRFCSEMGGKVNLIPYNPHPGSQFQRTEDANVKAFQHYLISRGMSATVRKSRGSDILAACGQLRSAPEVGYSYRDESRASH